MNAQPHDWASHLDQVPVLDDPQSFLTRRPRISLFLVRRQRSAAQNAWSALDQLKHGTHAWDQHIVDRPTAFTRPSSPRTWIRVPLRFVGHAVVLGLVLAVIASGGLPSLALGMDWTQSVVAATDHIDNQAASEVQTGAAAPLVIDSATSMAATTDFGEARDALVPSLLPRQVTAASAFIGVHTVASGEKLGQIAERYNVSVMTIVAANDLNPKMLAIGQQLRIPRVSGLPHKVADGETVDAIAQLYNVPASTIRFFPANNLSNGRALSVGEEIFIPGAVAIGSGPSEAEVAQVTAMPVGTVLDDETRIRTGPSTEYEKVAKLAANTSVKLIGRYDNWFKIQTANGTEGWIAADLLGIEDGVADQVPLVADVPVLATPVVPVASDAAQPDAPEPSPPPPPQPTPAPKPVPSNRWVWPTTGDITSPFGYRSFSVSPFHNGLDIANAKNTLIRAARAGRVIQAGWCSGYGYCVMIDHGDGYVTEYGHMAAMPNVRTGQYVNAGDRIGLMGSTYDRAGGGYSTGNHLHFTIKLSGKAVNPMRYLP